MATHLQPAQPFHCCFQQKCAEHESRLVHYRDFRTTWTARLIHSLCGEEFSPDDIEKTSQPHLEPQGVQAQPGKPCVACRLHIIGHRHDHARDRYLGWLLLQAHWLLADAQHQLHQQLLGATEHRVLADVCEQLTGSLRERAQHLDDTAASPPEHDEEPKDPQ